MKDDAGMSPDGLLIHRRRRQSSPVFIRGPKFRLQLRHFEAAALRVIAAACTIIGA
jgi:hypothetical protein